MGKKTAYVLKERKLSRLIGLILLIAGIIVGIIGWVTWHWIALPASVFIFFMIGNFYSYIMIDRIRKKTGFDDAEIKRLFRHPPY